MKFMVVGVIPDSQAYAVGVAPGCTVVKVDGSAVRSVNNLMPLVGSGSVSVTVERPCFGHVVAKTGSFAGMPTCSTWKDMGLSHDKLDAAFGHNNLFSPSGRRKIWSTSMSRWRAPPRSYAST